ncbi:MAG: hypothetical protein PHP23_11800 [Desulfobacterales bacterium]|nr:hypothetical protein [Desulfobacterales bacterium]MDD4072616.1 hypothetical protein [Desulfobacterales bacterium]MDD4393985.1 hypothetical protein [Desulfobacterales bacterium]
MKLFLLVAMVFFSTSMLQAAQVPRSEKDLPIFPGAVRDNAAENETMTQEKDLHAMPMDTSEEHPMIARSFSVFIYTVDAPAEKVLRFYLEKLGGKEDEASEYFYAGNTPSGSTSPVSYRIDFIDLSVYNPEEAVEARAELEKVRVPFEFGNWVSSADFVWEVGEKNGDVSNFELTIQDDYFHRFNARGDKKVQASIVIRKTTYMNPDDAQMALQKFNNTEDGVDDSSQGNMVGAATPFNPEDLGITVYPGSVYDAETTTFLRESMGLQAGAYQSEDNSRKISLFFEKFGLKRIHADENEILLKRCREEYNPCLKKAMSTGECDVEITIQKPWRDIKNGELRQNALISIVDCSE